MSTTFTKLTREQIALKDSLVSSLKQHNQNLATAFIEYNAVVKSAWEKLNEVQVAYNGAIEDAKTFAQTVAEKIEDGMRDKSDTWLQSPKGEAVDDFLTKWQDVTLDDVELNEPEELDINSVEDHAVLLGELPDEIEF